MYYNFFKMPGGCLLYVERKRSNTQIYNIEWSFGELFICVGIWRFIYTPFYKPKKPIVNDGHTNSTESGKSKPSRSSVIPFKNYRKVS